MLNMEQESFINELIDNGNDTIEKLNAELQFCLDAQPEYSDFLLPIMDILNHNPTSIEYLLKKI